MDIVLVSMFLQVSIFGFGIAEYDIKIVDVDVPWNEASQGCENIGYGILDPTMVSKTTLVSHGLLQEGEQYWTSQYKSRSPFYWKLGCYGVTDRSSLNETDFGNEISVYQCSQKCGDVQYIGLENTTCYCFPASARLSKESKTPCTTPCPGNADEICGESGSGKMSVYRKLDVSEDSVTLDGNKGDCVTINKEDVEKLYDYYSYDEHQLFTDQICTEERTFFCRNYQYDPLDISSEIFIFNAENKTWYDAQQFCLSQGNDMAYIDGSNALGVLSRDMIPVGSESWVGLFRTTVEISIARSDVPSDPVSCRSISSNGNVLEKMYQPCMNKLKTLCMRETTTTEAPTTEALTTPSSTTEAQTTETPTTETPTTETPTTEVTTTETPTTEVTTTETSTTETPTTETPTTEVPTTETPTTEVPTTETPTTEVPTTETPTTEIPITETTTTKVPTTETPTTEVPTTKTPITEPPTTVILAVVDTEETTLTSSIITTSMSAAGLPGADTSTKTLTTKETTTEENIIHLKPNEVNVAEKKVGNNEDDGAGTKDSGLLIILIALAVILVIAIILMALAYKRYKKNRSYQKVSLMTVTPYPKSSSGTHATQTPPSPVKTPTPRKPARTTSMKENRMLLDISQGNFVSQSDQYVPGTRDDVSWNLPFIDASRETLDNIDETKPVMVRRTILLSEDEANNLNIGQPNASVDLDDKVSHSHSNQDTDAPECKPMLNSIEGDDDIFDDNIDSQLPRSPSERIDLLFRQSLSGENE